MPEERRVLDLVEQALALPEAERSAFLEEACADDAELRAEVDRLLAITAGSESFLEPPARDDIRGLLDLPGGELGAGVRLGRYRLVRRIATGGMATVYEAMQDKPERRVALKLLKLDIADAAMRRRFQSEAEILAHLRHPGIAEVYEAGVARPEDGSSGPELPFIAMEFVEGARPITEYARANDLTIRERLDLFREVCTAVHHGHLKGVLHRDLKPANLLVDRDGRPKVIDFGVARATESEPDSTRLTEVGQILGTLHYMSPEQFEVHSLDLDLRSDVYSLGIVLYELLCGCSPYDLERRAIHEVARVVREEPPRRPSTVVRVLSGDLEAILYKALEKDRDRRYDSVVALGEDVGRFLLHQPIDARPPSVVYRVRRFVRRNRLLVGSALTVALALIVATVVSIRYAFEADEQRSQAHQAQVAEAQERERAEELFHSSLDLHLAFFDRFVERVRQLRGATRLSQEMMEALAANLETIRAGSENDPEALLLLANAWLRLGKLRANPQSANLGERELGAQDYRNALQLAQRVRALDPDQLEAARLAGSSLVALGDLAVAEGDLAGARSFFERRLALEDELPGDAGDTQRLEALILGHDRLGQVCGLAEDHDGALEHFLESHALAERLDTLAPSTSTRQKLGITHGGIAAVHLSRGEWDEAVDRYDAQLELLEELIDEDPDHATLVVDEAIVLELRSRALRELGELDLAEEDCLRALSNLEELTEVDPDDARLPVLIATMSFALGTVESERARAASGEQAREHWLQARSWFEDSLEIVEERARRGHLRPAEQGYAGKCREQIAECDRHLSEG